MTTTKKILALLACLAFVLSSVGLCFGSDAVFDVPVGPDSLWNANSMYSVWPTLEFQALVNRNGESGATRYVSPSSEFPVYAFAYYNSSTNNDFVCFCSPGRAITYRAIYTNQWYTYTETLNSLDSASGLYFGTEGNLYVQPYTVDSDLPYFEDRATGLLTVSAALQAHTEQFLYQLPSGYLFRLSSTDEFTVNRRFYSLTDSTYNFLHLRNSNSGSDGVTDFRENGSFHGVVLSSSLVNGATVGSIFTGSGNEVPFQATNANILGRATDYSYLGTTSWTVPVGSSFVIWYPYYYGLTDPDINEPDLHLNLIITHSQPLTCEVFKLQADSVVYDNSVIVTSSLTNNSTTGTQSESGDDQITITTTNTPTGGGNAGDAPISDNLSLTGVISRLVNDIKGLFSSAVQGITELVNTGSSFMQSIAAMFTWLPSPVLSIIIAAFTVLLVVGVLKVLWR